MAHLPRRRWRRFIMFCELSRLLSLSRWLSHPVPDLSRSSLSFLCCAVPGQCCDDCIGTSRIRSEKRKKEETNRDRGMNYMGRMPATTGHRIKCSSHQQKRCFISRSARRRVT
ncbi:hypothetical protein F4861DRAFT_391864 [Xylaria intraflava]|nr:hypothetical protein F4861DRAFT_391864 [Xylaria intraflava]